ncbi:MAG TPA: dihydrolipoyl dehydrogenase [Rhabdochlamydiaceae bacterium]|nr:dihydrolipoyl dehydrogenase [Rhabdochlamydiaceae bacterium]
MNTFDVVIIGSGPGGYVAAIRAAQLGFKVACIDKRKELGGTCLNIGCIPSKTLLHASELYWKMVHEAEQYGLKAEKYSYSFQDMMKRKQKVVTSFNEGIAALFQKNKITFLPGAAKLISSTVVQVAGEQIGAKHIILATGSEPISLPFLPFDEKKIVSSTGALSLAKVPERLLVVGAGVIGVELGSVYSRLGSKVEFVEFLDKICPTLDESISKELQKILTKQGMAFRLSTKVTGAELSSTEVALRLGQEQLKGDIVLVSVGRRPYTQHLGLEAVGITPTAKGAIPIDHRFRTTVPNIYAIGDIVDGPMLAHKASEEGVAVAEIIAGQNPSVNYLAIPNVIYTYPEVAAVGLTEAEAKTLGATVKTGMFPFKINSRAKCTGEEDGFVKIVSDQATDQILGVHIIGAHASELISAGALAIQNRLTTLELAHTPHAHPTLSEALKEAALALHGRALHR